MSWLANLSKLLYLFLAFFVSVFLVGHISVRFFTSRSVRFGYVGCGYFDVLYPLFVNGSSSAHILHHFVGYVDYVVKVYGFKILGLVFILWIHIHVCYYFDL
jgi:hypothetical protein